MGENDDYRTEHVQHMHVQLKLTGNKHFMCAILSHKL